MTNSTSLQQSDSKAALLYVVNLIGVIAGTAVTVASISTLNPTGFFVGIVAAMFCLDGVRK